MTGDDDSAAAEGDQKLPGWMWNEKRMKLLWEALTKVQQVCSRSGALVSLTLCPMAIALSWYTCPLRCAMIQAALSFLDSKFGCVLWIVHRSLYAGIWHRAEILDCKIR